MFNLEYLKNRILSLRKDKYFQFVNGKQVPSNLQEDIVQNTNIIIKFCVEKDLPLPYDAFASEEGEIQLAWQVDGLDEDGFHFLSNVNCRNIEILICKNNKIICNKNMGNRSLSFDEEKESYIDEECDKEMYISDTKEIYNFINWVTGDLNGKIETETKY